MADRCGEIRVCFWKEEPQLHYAFDLVESSEVFVVPVFMSEGYFTDRIIPRELRIKGRVTHRDGRRIHYCPPVGTDPRMAELVLDRATEVEPGVGEPSGDLTLVVLGHGTDRHPKSAGTTVAVAEKLQNNPRFSRVVPAFLDQEPDFDRVLNDEVEGDVVVVPFFVSEGWHVGTTIERGRAEQDVAEPGRGGAIRYTRPVGTHPKMTEVVQDLVSREAGGQGKVADPRAGEIAERAQPAAEARRAFISWIRETQDTPKALLQTIVRWTDSSGFEIRHERDRNAPVTELRALQGPGDALRIAAKTAEGEHRPLKTAPDLASGWRFSGLSDDDVWEVYAGLYPAVPVHRHLEAQGRLPIVSFRETAKRQTGMYERIGEVSDSAVEALVEDRCSESRCLRHPSWASDDPPESGPVGARVPCPAPCSVFLSEAAEVIRKTP